ncbi:Protein kinase domain [Dillenia turbinata]|uniref:Protein kinase domain n=1 Tax=Dillenia turbinata TaxID=194707 RepID=A0AAN8W4R2_9MAGN
MAISQIHKLFLICLAFPYFILFTSYASTEGEILLTFKASIEDPSDYLSTWSNTSLTNYCNWTGVTCSFTSIISLNLQSLNLSGEISPSVCDLKNISFLNLADNLFEQPIPLHLSQCSSLETLNLSNNLIWGTIPDQISQFSSLKVLDFSKNHVEGKIPETIGSLKKLQVLNLGSNLLSGGVPFVFGNFSELVFLDLSQNPFLVSEIPSEIGKLVKLEQILLQSSNFFGKVPSSFVGLQSLRILDLSQNNLSGLFPQTFGGSMYNLMSFDISQNNLMGSFPSGVCEGKSLINLSLHSNLFNGSIPESIDQCLNLEKFQVQNNDFSGDFPGGLWSLPSIKLIRAENNRFSGEIPDSVSMAAQLEQVQIDNNSFTSKIPQTLGLVKSLYRFSASVNAFHGDIPSNFCDSPVMSIINLSHNLLSGQIPELKKCKKLVSVSLADNKLSGKIPASLGDLPVLTYLDLSDNNLTGEIPLELENLKLALFNVSFNHLSGRVPYTLISGFPASYVQGNPQLCGPGLSNMCPGDNSGRQSFGLSKLACALISLAFAAGIIVIAVGFFTIYRSYTRKSEMVSWRSVFFYPLRLGESDLMMSMDEKCAVGSGGAFGKVYSISLPSGELVAVKKLFKSGTLSSKVLKAEIKVLAKIRHKNIAKILGFCHNDDLIFLIYEYLPKGSLGDLIGRPDFQMQWSVRMKIAIGVAQGLSYLHKDYVPHLLHRNLKSRNVLLDGDFEPKLTDFALDRIVGENAFTSCLASESAFSCYMAPGHVDRLNTLSDVKDISFSGAYIKLGYSKKATEQMDTYSFGVVLLELVTGRSAEQRESDDSPDLVKWVRRRVNISDGALQVLDPKISSSCQQEMLGALEIALCCTSVVPEKRPSMFDVTRALQSNVSSHPLDIEFSNFDENSYPV